MLRQLEVIRNFHQFSKNTNHVTWEEVNIHRILFKTMSVQASIIHIDADLLIVESNKIKKSCAITFKVKVMV